MRIWLDTNFILNAAASLMFCLLDTNFIWIIAKVFAPTERKGRMERCHFLLGWPANTLMANTTLAKDFDTRWSISQLGREKERRDHDAAKSCLFLSGIKTPFPTRREKVQSKSVHFFYSFPFSRTMSISELRKRRQRQKPKLRKRRRGHQTFILVRLLMCKWCE